MEAGPHAALMDGIYRRQRFIYDATRRFYLFGRDRLLDGLDAPAGGTVLEVGCGTARNLIAAARRYPDARLYGLDISEEMLRTARGKITNAGCAGRVRLAPGDATAFDAAALFGIASFDRVFISYALSMIPPWRDAVACAAGCLAPGGSLHVVDFGDFAGYPLWMRRAQLSWLRRFSVRPIPQLEDELARTAERLGCGCDISRHYGGYAVVARLRRPPGTAEGR